MLIEKSKRLVDDDYREWVSALPCLKCVQEFDIELSPIYENDPAHIRKGTDGATSRKPSDFWIVPLCRAHHTEQHAVGEVTFWGSALELAKRTARAIYKVYAPNDYGPAIEVIGKFRKAVTK